MGRGSYLGGSTIIRTKPWKSKARGAREGSHGILGCTPDDLANFVGETGLVRAKDMPTKNGLRKRSRAKSSEKEQDRAAKRKARRLAEVRQQQPDPAKAEKIAAIEKRLGSRMGRVVVERKKAKRLMPAREG